MRLNGYVKNELKDELDEFIEKSVLKDDLDELKDMLDELNKKFVELTS